tara:strand:- start:1536 stop:1811 length:276 start_codon:yes stop_codon:yes gene_type:complete
MSHAIHKDDINRWFLVYDNDTGEESFILFGYVGPININELSTGQPNILSFLTEDELEIYLDNIAGDNYYKDAVETSSDKFQGPSGKYVPIE